MKYKMRQKRLENRQRDFEEKMQRNARYPNMYHKPGSMRKS